ncbi:hypothetical protein Csa_023632, partial [Cucumis sativus]
AASPPPSTSHPPSAKSSIHASTLFTSVEFNHVSSSSPTSAVECQPCFGAPLMSAV